MAVKKATLGDFENITEFARKVFEVNKSLKGIRLSVYLENFDLTIEDDGFGDNGICIYSGRNDNLIETPRASAKVLFIIVLNELSRFVDMIGSFTISVCEGDGIVSQDTVV